MVRKKELLQRIETLEKQIDETSERMDRMEHDGSAVHFDHGLLTFRSFMKNFREIFRAEHEKCQQSEAAGKGRTKKDS